MSDEGPTKYRVLNKLLPGGTIQQMIFDTLNLYHKEEDLSNSPIIQWGRRTLKAGAWWYGCEKRLPYEREKCLEERQQKVINLYLDMKNNDYNGSTISIYFDKDGNIRVYDGFHRLAILKYLGLETMMNCQISPRKSDFPLVEALTEINSGTNLYQPCDDERLKDFHVWRKDSSKRLEFVLENIGGSTVLDIGCSEGYFSRELAKRDYEVTALDSGKKRIAITRYLSTINNLEMNYHRGKWQEYLVGKNFDVILYLSVFHHDILTLGIDDAFKQLEKFRGRVKQVFFESPISSQKIYWIDEDKKKELYDFTEEEFKAKIEEATQMNVTKVMYGTRPIFLLEAQILSKEGISR